MAVCWPQAPQLSSSCLPDMAILSALCQPQPAFCHTYRNEPLKVKTRQKHKHGPAPPTLICRAGRIALWPAIHREGKLKHTNQQWKNMTDPSHTQQGWPLHHLANTPCSTCNEPAVAQRMDLLSISPIVYHKAFRRQALVQACCEH